VSTRTNYCPNPTCSVNGSDYFGGAGSARATGLTGFTNRTTGYRFVGAADAVHPKSAAAVANTAYVYSSEIKPEYSGTITPQIDWYQNGAYYSSATGSAVAVTNGTVQRVYIGATSPAISGTIQGLLFYKNKAGTVVSAEVLYEQGTLSLTYFDGDSAGGAWLGTTGLSASTVTVADAANVFPTTATFTAVANDPLVTRTSSSPSAELATASLTANNATVRVIGEGPPLDLPPETPEPVWTLYARNSSLGRSAQIDDFASLDAICRFNDVGTWELQLDFRATAATELAQPGAGIEIRRDDFVIMTGPVTRVRRDRADSKNLLVVSGVDDNVWLRRRLAHPQPASSAPPYNSSADDVRTGVGSTVIWEYVNVNLGPGAIAPRRLSTLVMGTDPGVGESVSGRARYDVLLELIQDLAVAGGDLAFRITQTAGVLQFDVYEPEDKSDSIVFSDGFGNLSSYSYEQQAPEYTYVYGGGDGEGIDRSIVEGQDPSGVATWGRIEKLVDARQTEDAPEVSQQIDTALSENSERLGLEITPIDTPNLKYGEHYQLGDRVAVVVDGVLISDNVRQVEIKLTQDGPQTLTPVLGTPGRVELLGLFAAVRDLASRTRNLERR
jgi:hypothetical protein